MRAKNQEGYPDPTAAEAMRQVEKENRRRIPAEVVAFREGLKYLCCKHGVHILGKVTVTDREGRRW